jgi:SNF2 family DNA or RNA helicase
MTPPKSSPSQNPFEKVLVFSQFTKFLDMVERALDARFVRSARMDGSMTR